ncbi:MAG: phage holin [Prevotellaceae bacterium]|nr:phage holin [Candidatus Faecinaster equi]
MKINWKLRGQNKVTLVSIMALVVAFVYQVLGLFGVVPKVAESDIVNLLTMLIDILVAIGVVTDPTTKGLNDSERAMGYDEPN